MSSTKETTTAHSTSEPKHLPASLDNEVIATDLPMTFHVSAMMEKN